MNDEVVQFRTRSNRSVRVPSIKSIDNCSQEAVTEFISKLDRGEYPHLDSEEHTLRSINFSEGTAPPKEPCFLQNVEATVKVGVGLFSLLSLIY